jgi:proteasome accessory factor C
VVAIEGRWYLDAYCHNAKGMRRFRVDRVSSAQPTGAPMSQSQPGSGAAERDGPVPPDRRDVSSTDGAAFVPGPDAIVARLAVDNEAAWIVEAVPTLGTTSRPDGRTEVTLSVASTVWFGRLLLRLGPHAEVLDPPELAEAGREAARHLLSRYRPAAPPARGRKAAPKR